MGIRRAMLKDAIAITRLLNQLGYPGTGVFLINKFRTINENPNAEMIVYERDGEVVGFVELDLIVQIAIAADITRVSYFVVDASVREMGIGNVMEEYCTKWARDKLCDRIEVHCSDLRIGANQFYRAHGYSESPMYFIKELWYEIHSS